MTGFWTMLSKDVPITDIDLAYVNEEGSHGELRVWFENWNTRKDGLIYTDRLFIKELRSHLIRIGFGKTAARQVDYSEHGMQGSNFVSFDVGPKFIEEFEKLSV